MKTLLSACLLLASLANPAFLRAEEYIVGPRDVIEIDVRNHPEFHSVCTVNPEGFANAIILGEIKVQGMTLRQIRDHLTGVLARDYLKDPQVVVTIKEFNNLRVYVFGRVKSPGQKELSGPTNLLDLIMMTGETADDAGGEITIERAPTPVSTDLTSDRTEPAPEVIRIDMARLVKQGDLSLNIPLKNGDKIYIPGAMAQGQVHVFGQVQKPGDYAFKPGMTIFDAIEAAGGFTDFANEKSVKIKRQVEKDGESKEDVIKVNLKKMLKEGELSSNVPILPGDVVVVPSSFFF